MTQQFDRLTDPRLCIVVMYATAGLGHLRVAKALIEELPPACNPILMDDATKSVSYLHQMTSNSKTANNILEFTQQGWAEDITMRFSRFFLIQNANQLKKRLIDVLKRQSIQPTTLLVVATHFGMAHQVAHIKSSLEREMNITIRLVVQITDDSPQKIWYVPHADYLISPSMHTTKSLQSYGQTEGLGKSPGITLPYPLSPVLTAPLSQTAFENKVAQADPSSSHHIHVCIPISGAGVGLPYFHSFMKKLHNMEPRIMFHVVARRTLYTSPHLRSWKKQSYITVADSRSDREVIDLYESVYKQFPILIELTKPSEQAFKACIPPKYRGGSILLFTQPIGRQEYDNLHFLRRHKLIPPQGEETTFIHADNAHPQHSILANHWRGLCISNEPQEAAQWFANALRLGIFQRMLHWQQIDDSNEVAMSGATQFWTEVSQLL